MRGAQDLDSATAISVDQYGDWPVRYHLCPERANLLRHLDFSGLRVVELGAGMGAISRYLAERARSLMVVEGTAARFAALRERLRDLSNWRGEVANIQDLEPPPEPAELADVVCLIGVLEYSELHVRAPSGHSPFSWVLERAKRLLAPGGVLVLAIENRLGLKYWSGAPEDHTGRNFDGILGYASSPTPRTFSRRELRTLLCTAGLPEIREYFPFPDYKVPNAVVSGELCELAPDLVAELGSTAGFESYGPERAKLFPDYLALVSVARAGLLREFANSFLFLAARAPSPTLERLTGSGNELGWHYALHRRVATRTVFVRATEAGAPQIHVRKDALDPARAQVAGARATWRSLPASRFAAGEPLRRRLLRAAHFGAWHEFRAELLGFLAWSLEHWALEDDRRLLGEGALDAVWINASCTADRDFVLFDLEWSWHEPLPRSWFVLRNLHVLNRERDYLGTAPFGTLGELYLDLCRELSIQDVLEADLALEAQFQADVLGAAEQTVLANLRELFARPFGPPQFGIRGPSELPRESVQRVLTRVLRARVREQLDKRPHFARLVSHLRATRSR